MKIKPQQRRMLFAYLSAIGLFLIFTLITELILGILLCNDNSHIQLSLWEHAAEFLFYPDASCGIQSPLLNILILLLSAMAGAGIGYQLNRELKDKERLQYSERLLQEAFNIVHEGVFEWGYPADSVYLSEGFFRICGYDRPSSIVSIKERESFIHPDDREYDRNQLSEAIQNYTLANYQIRLRHRNGNYFPVHVRGKVHTVDAFQRRYYIVGTVRELSTTLLAQLEAAQLNNRLLLKAENEHETIYEISFPDLTIAQNVSTDFQVNGYSLRQLVNRNLSELLSVRESEDLNHWLNTPADTNQIWIPYQIDTILEPEKGVSLPVRLIFSKGMQDHAKTVVIMRLRDLTNEYNANINTLLLAKTANHLPNGLVIARGDGTICYFNQSAEKLLPMLREEDNVFRLLSPEDTKRYRTLWHFLKRRLSCTFSHTLNGIPFEVDCDYLNISDGYLRFSLRDCTRFHQQVQKMNEALAHEQQANQKRLTLLNTINYELRKPLTGILGFADLLRDDALSQEEREEYLKVIISSGNRLLQLWTGVLELMSLECGAVEPQCEMVNLNSLFHHLEASYSDRIPKGVEFHIQKTLRDVDANVVSDESILVQIFDKLLSNSIKFTRQGWIEIGYRVSDNMIRFSVADSGCGIPLENQQDIFTPFQKDILSGRNSHGSYGMGLPIVKQLIDLLHGTIAMQNTPGGGTRIIFTIPLKTELPGVKEK